MNNLLKKVLALQLATPRSPQSDFIIIADTSGSVEDDLMNRMLQEIQDIARTFTIPLLVLYVDYTYQGCQFIESGEQVELCPAGGGGTDFRAGFGYIGEQGYQPDLVLYLTDGQCPFFPEEPGYKVIWAQFGEAYFEPPFGQKIQIVHHLTVNQ